MSATSDIENTIAATSEDLHRIDAPALIEPWINRLQNVDGGAPLAKELQNLRGILNGNGTDIATVANSLQKLSDLTAQVALNRHGFEYDALRHLNQHLASMAGQIRAGF